MARNQQGQPIIPPDVQEIMDLAYKINQSLTLDRFNRKYEQKLREWSTAKMEAIRSGQPPPPKPQRQIPSLDEMRSPEIQERQEMLDAVYENRLGKNFAFVR